MQARTPAILAPLTILAELPHAASTVTTTSFTLGLEVAQLTRVPAVRADGFAAAATEELGREVALTLTPLAAKLSSGRTMG